MMFLLEWRDSPDTNLCLQHYKPFYDSPNWDPAHGRLMINKGYMLGLLWEMQFRKMLSFDDSPPFPQPADYGLVKPPHPGTIECATHPDPSVRAFHNHYVRCQSQRPNTPGIAMYKLCHKPDMFWLVTRDEINDALEQLAEYPASFHPLWEDWIVFLRGAVLHGGFEVV
jgi:hypothetical protein